MTALAEITSKLVEVDLEQGQNASTIFTLVKSIEEDPPSVAEV
jgi:hypothetical protein